MLVAVVLVVTLVVLVVFLRGQVLRGVVTVVLGLAGRALHGAGVRGACGQRLVGLLVAEAAACGGAVPHLDVLQLIVHWLR